MCKLESADLSEASVVEEIKKRNDGVSRTLQLLEGGDPEMVALWEETKKWSMNEFYNIYNWLGARFDHYFYESEAHNGRPRVNS